MRFHDHLSEQQAGFSAMALTPIAQAMQGSLILKIAAEVRARVARGEPVCNLTVGDFNPKIFPIPRLFQDEVHAAYEAGQTNYPPSEGLPELRQAIASWYRRYLKLEIDPDWIVVASGARPVMYATYRLFLGAGETAAYAVPSWNNSYYTQLCGATSLPIPTRAANQFFPTPEDLRPILKQARVFALNSPLNPTGTVISPEALKAIAQCVVEENELRKNQQRPPLIWMWDQVYWQLTFGTQPHVHPATLVPEVIPYTVTVDAISKAFAATGLRVGWAVLPPILAERMKSLLGHIGAWAPRPEQIATAKLLSADAEMNAFHHTFRAALSERLERLSVGLKALNIEHLVPQGAMYLSVRFSLFGRLGVDQKPMTTNEDIRRYLLERAGLAVVPFQAFDLEEDSGWFRMSVGAVSLSELDALFERLPAILN